MDKMARIDARRPVFVKEMIGFAAALEGRTRTDFLIEAASEKARKVISESQTIQLSLRDQKMLADAFAEDTGRKPDDFLEKIAAQYRETVISK